MGLLQWLWRGPPQGRGVIVGDGEFEFRVVGTMRHQFELERIAGARTRRGYHRKCAALLVRQPDNPFDRHAVAVVIGGIEVGFLDREDARDFGSILRASRFVDAACEAEIVGGWERAAEDRGYVGVRLNACLPFRIVGAEEWYGERPRRE